MFCKHWQSNHFSVNVADWSFNHLQYLFDGRHASGFHGNADNDDFYIHVMSWFGSFWYPITNISNITGKNPEVLELEFEDNA
jgi:hypothetical protein